MRKKFWIVVGTMVFLIVAGLFIRFIIGGNEDSWIKNEKGEYVEHGAPSEIPDYVSEQGKAVIQALELYHQKKAEGMIFSSQCLGVVGDNIKFAVDIVHIPRSEEDDKPENQCQDYREGRVQNFIELDKDGNIVRIA